MDMAPELLRIGDGQDWRFVNGAWSDGAEGLLTVATERRYHSGAHIQGHHYAFNMQRCYRDVRIRFEFLLTPHSDIGVIMRATDESHFSLLHFPNCGQACRAQHFWAAFSRMDETGYLRLIKMGMVRRVPSNPGLWLTADVQLVDNRLSVRVGENGYFQAEACAPAPAGHIGLYCSGAAELRRVTVQTDMATQRPVWRDDSRQPTNWFHPRPEPADGLWQKPQSLLRLADNELLLSYGVQRPPHRDAGPTMLIRSRDNGRTWSAPQPLTKPGARWQPTCMHLTPGGRLLAVGAQEDRLLVASSSDGADTWSAPAPLDIGPGPPLIERLHMGPQAFLNLRDGSMVMFLYGACAWRDTALPIFTWGSHHCQAFACRSWDDGRTWAPLINLDNPGCDESGAGYPGNLDLTEACGVQMGDGRIMALVRPIYSPWMWETWSADGGATWGPCLRGPFPGYAAPNMLRLASGAVLVAHRLPATTIHCSRDEGHSWDEGTLIDGAVWCMGSMIEVEPDVVFYVYYDSFESLMRAQFIRVTPTGLKPARSVQPLAKEEQADR